MACYRVKVWRQSRSTIRVFRLRARKIVLCIDPVPISHELLCFTIHIFPSGRLTYAHTNVGRSNHVMAFANYKHFGLAFNVFWTGGGYSDRESRHGHPYHPCAIFPLTQYSKCIIFIASCNQKVQTSHWPQLLLTLRKESASVCVHASFLKMLQLSVFCVWVVIFVQFCLGHLLARCNGESKGP